jgi:acyl-CoA thioester hydrolase
METEGIALPVIEVHCEYRQPARYDDDIEIRTRAALVTPIRVRFEYELVRQDQCMVASGYTVHASLDATGRPCRLPARVAEMLT